MTRLGLIVNPIAGLGGSVGLKGTDGADAAREALRLGAAPRSAARAEAALRELTRLDGLQTLVYAGGMGEFPARNAGLSLNVVGAPSADASTPEDTRRAAAEMSKRGAALILFAGGDGTARDVCESVGERTPALGVPAGVKMHSGVYAVSPRSAGAAALRFLSGDNPHTTLAEVMDIDEDAYRRGEINVRLFGYLRTPDDASAVQATKSPTSGEEAEDIQTIAAEVVHSMESGSLYILGPGATTRAVARELCVPNTLLGVDVILDRYVVASDASEARLLELLDGGPAKIIVTAIGGQGHIFGRGNQQISAEVIRRVGRENIIVIATRRKLAALGRRPLLVDSGDPDIDRELAGYAEVVTGRAESAMMRVAG